MLLYIVRHGIAIDRDDPSCPPDPERYLTKEGIAKTREAARGVRALGAEPQRMISSPYVRAMQTATIFAETFHFSAEKILTSEALLPEADPAKLFRELDKLKKPDEVFCFGHAPNVDELVARALAVPAGITSMKKAGVACLEMDELSPPRGHLVWICTPKILRSIRA